MFGPAAAVDAPGDAIVDGDERSPRSYMDVVTPRSGS